MAASVYKVIEIVGTSRTSWDKAAANAIERARKNLKDLRVAEVRKMDVKVKGKKMLYRVRLDVSFKIKG